MKMQRVNLSQYSMKLCIEPRSDCSLGLKCFHRSEFIFDSDFYPWVGLDPWLGFHSWENWSLGRIEASVEFILGSDFTLGSGWILGSDFTLGKIRPSVEFILGSDFILASEFSSARIFPLCHFCRRY